MKNTGFCVSGAIESVSIFSSFSIVMSSWYAFMRPFNTCSDVLVMVSWSAVFELTNISICAGRSSSSFGLLCLASLSDSILSLRVSALCL